MDGLVGQCRRPMHGGEPQVGGGAGATSEIIDEAQGRQLA